MNYLKVNRGNISSFQKKLSLIETKPVCISIIHNHITQSNTKETHHSGFEKVILYFLVIILYIILFIYVIIFIPCKEKCAFLHSMLSMSDCCCSEFYIIKCTVKLAGSCLCAAVFVCMRCSRCSRGRRRQM